MDATTFLRIVPAYLIDFILVVFLMAGYAYFFGEHNSDGSITLNHNYAKTELLIFAHLYFIIQEYFFANTIGKRILKLHVKKTNGEKLRLIDVVLRHCTNTVELFLFPFIALGVGILSKKNQRLGDMIAKTVVVDKSL